ncbi:hypothetical protein T440DRAFT_57958 [Plenodomus tracheiphilus IPT5]|uniref:Uncharacterized protein n=1 Tax=Plenodomus tracheiphilus IPT5 TaxID=1408161 RepID=A0A6A7BC85_9PLEO|nr:hypothetical protein T440DRAFT_57958 [Plenodomus tracheiphilus IPT5]
MVLDRCERMASTRVGVLQGLRTPSHGPVFLHCIGACAPSLVDHWGMLGVPSALFCPEIQGVTVMRSNEVDPKHGEGGSGVSACGRLNHLVEDTLERHKGGVYYEHGASVVDGDTRISRGHWRRRQTVGGDACFNMIVLLRTTRHLSRSTPLGGALGTKLWTDERWYKTSNSFVNDVGKAIGTHAPALGHDQ